MNKDIIKEFIEFTPVMNNYIRHGDVFLRRVKTLPKNLKKINKGNSHVLAYGEVTGHKHLLTLPRTDTSFEVLEDEKGNMYLRMGADGKLTHEEHKELTIEKGYWIVEHEREYDYFALQSR